MDGGVANAEPKNRRPQRYSEGDVAQLTPETPDQVISMALAEGHLSTDALAPSPPPDLPESEYAAWAKQFLLGTEVGMFMIPVGECPKGDRQAAAALIGRAIADAEAEKKDPGSTAEGWGRVRKKGSGISTRKIRRLKDDEAGLIEHTLARAKLTEMLPANRATPLILRQAVHSTAVQRMPGDSERGYRGAASSSSVTRKRCV